MKLMRLIKLIAFTAFILLFASCKVKPLVTEQKETIKETTRYIRETIKDTTYIVEADSCSIKALLECDSLGKVQLKQIESYKGGRLLKPPVLKIGTDNTITITNEIDSFNIYLKYKEVHELNIDNTINNGLQTIEVNRLTNLQNLQIWFANIMLLLVVGYAIFKLSKPRILRFLQG